MITRTSALLFAALILLSAAVAAEDPPQYSAWSTPENLTVINSIAAEAGAFISRDGLSLYFGSTRDGTFDIWVSHRPCKDMPWEAPRKLELNINTPGCNEQTPTLSMDGHWLYFARDCGGFGGQDLFVSRRHNKRDDSGWQLPVNLGSGVNSTANESCPALLEDDESGMITLYFNSDRLRKSYEDISVSTLQEDETFGPAVFVGELNDPDPNVRDVRPFVWKNGLIMLLDSNRPGTLGGQDLFISVRASTSDPWSPPVNLGAVFNSGALEARPVLSFDGTELYFHSNRPAGTTPNDIYRSTRTKLKSPHKDKLKGPHKDKK